MAFRTKKPKSSDILVSHHDQICVILSTTDTILLPFTNKLFEKHIIDRSTKNEISHKAGYKAADTLLDCLEMRVDANPSLLQTVFEVMREVDTLTDVVEKMERMEKEWLAKQEDMQGIPLTDSSMIGELDILDTVVEAKKLKQEFEELLVAILDVVRGVDLDNLKLRISWFFNAEGFITADVQAILDQLQSLTSPQYILNFLVTRNFIGYLNYELTKAFQKAVKSDQLKAKIEEYEDKHDAFIRHFSFNAIIEAFRQRPSLAPVSVVGLPQLSVRLETPWEGRSVYEWKEVLAKLLTWPPHLIIVSIEKNCIVIKYAVLPFFISSVSRDLKDPHVLELLKRELATVEFSEIAPPHQQVPVTSQEIDVDVKHPKDVVVVSKMPETSNKGVLQKFIKIFETTVTKQFELQGTYLRDKMEILRQIVENKRTFHSLAEQNKRERKALEDKEEKYKKELQETQENQKKLEEDMTNMRQEMTEQEENQKKEMEILEEEHRKEKRRLEDEMNKLKTQNRKQDDTISHLKRKQTDSKDVDDTDNQPLEEDKKTSLTTSLGLEHDVKDMLSLVEELKLTSEKAETQLDPHSKETTITEMIEKLRRKLESLRDKINLGKKVSSSETRELLDSRKQFEVLLSVIKELRLTEEEGTETRTLLDTLEKELHVLSLIIDELNKVLQDGTDKLKIYKKMNLVLTQELDKKTKKPEPQLSDIEDTDKTSLEEDEKGSLSTSQELVDEIKKKLSVIEELKMTAEEKEVTGLDKDPTLTDTFMIKLESLQDKLNSGKTLSTNESHELMDSQERLDDIIHLINKLRLIVEESIETQLKDEKDIKQQKESQEMVTTDEVEGEERSLNTNDVAVQFDYWVPMEDLLHGAHVVDEIVFNVHSDREQTYEWNECGFRLHVPKAALSPTEVCPVAIKALLGGRFILPEDTELVSALYAISQSRKFQKPVKAELQHCVFLENEAQTKRLHFIKAYQTQPGMPYLFEFAEGGEFPLEKRYGSLWHSEFCIFGIVRENGPGPVSEETNGSHHSTDEDDDVESTNGDETLDDETKSSHDSTDDEASEEVVNTKSTTVGQTPDVSKSQSHKQKEESHVTKRHIPDKTVQYHTEAPPPLNTVKSDAANTVYRAHTFYEKVSRNRWIFKFVAVKHLKVHIKYVVDSFSSLEKAEAFKFRFKDTPGSSDHSIVLKFTDEENRKLDKWHVCPYSLPCEISREDIDLLDTHELHVPLQGQPETPDIPMCMISLYVDDNTAAPLCYGVPVEGINEVKTIFIMRHVETLANIQEAQVTTETSQDIHHEQTTPKTPTTPDLKIDCKKLKEEIQRIFNEHFADLNQLLKNIIQVFADELFSVHLISDHVKSSPTYDAISNEVMSAMNFQRNPSKLVNHSVLFLKTMSKLGPPQQFAATSIADELTEDINENLKVQLAFTW